MMIIVVMMVVMVMTTVMVVVMVVVMIVVTSAFQADAVCSPVPLHFQESHVREPRSHL